MDDHDLVEAIKTDERERIARTIEAMMLPDDGTFKCRMDNLLVSICARVARTPPLASEMARKPERERLDAILRNWDATSR